MGLEPLTACLIGAGSVVVQNVRAKYNLHSYFLLEDHISKFSLNDFNDLILSVPQHKTTGCPNHLNSLLQMFEPHTSLHSIFLFLLHFIFVF